MLIHKYRHVGNVQMRYQPKNKQNRKRRDCYSSPCAKIVISLCRPPPLPPAYQCVCTLCRLHIRLSRSVCGEMLAGQRRHLVALHHLNQAAGMSAARRGVSDLYLSLVIFSDAAHAFVSAETVRTAPHITDVSDPRRGVCRLFPLCASIAPNFLWAHIVLCRFFNRKSICLYSPLTSEVVAKRGLCWSSKAKT